MPRISIDDAKAWVEESKLDPQALDLDHLDQIETELLVRIASIYDVSLWIDKTSTPRIIQVIISKFYVGWLYDKFYSENQGEPNKYSQLVKANAQSLLDGILSGVIEIPGVPAVNPVTAAFYPNDASSAINPDTGYYDPNLRIFIPGDTSTGPAKFSMGKRF